MSEQLAPTSGAAWRRAREEGEVITLASGNIVRVRAVPLDHLITSGRIPDILTPIAAKALWTDTEASVVADQVEVAKGFVELINLVVPAALLTPRVVETPTADDEISLADIDFQDKLTLFNLATGGAAMLRQFRIQQEKRMEPVSDSQDVRSAAE